MDLAKAARDPWVWGQLVLFLLVALAAPLLPRYVNLGSADFLVNRVDPLWLRCLGVPLIAAGAIVIAWGARSLGRNLTPGIEPLPAAALVTSGPYGHTRHPIYAGAVLLLTGYALAWSNWTLALILGVIALLYFDGKARAEERWLIGRFPEYEAYKRHVRRRVL
jgi:protein-S-isoprenylcysteine O-methyltransferase Ste14